MIIEIADREEGVKSSVRAAEAASRDDSSVGSTRT
jgi:hypothetical protein